VEFTCNHGRENGFCCFRNKTTAAIADINSSYDFVSKEQHMVLYAEVKSDQLISMFIISFKTRFMLGQTFLPVSSPFLWDSRPL